MKKGLLSPAKAIVFSIAFILLNLFLASASFAAYRVTGVTYGTQTGTATSGTATSVTYTFTLNKAGGVAGTADNILLTWASGTPTGVTWSFVGTNETVSNGTTTTPTFNPSSTQPTTTIKLTINTAAGTPASSYGFTVKITDNNGGGGPYSSSGLALVVGGPTISYTGSPFTYYTANTITSLTPTTTGGVPTGYSISPSLPSGLSFNSGTGVISGTPSAASAATTYTITATYSSGGPATTTINIAVLASSISYTGSSFTYYSGNTITSLTPNITGGTPTSYSVLPFLPAGLSFNTSTGVISGTPTATALTANYVVTANYSSGSPSTTTINIQVLASTISYAGSPFTYNAGTAIATASATEIGGNPTTYSSSPGLPAGLSLNTSTGDITGTATTPQAATIYTITATYTGGVTAITTISIKVQTPSISYAGSPFTFTTGVAITAANPTIVNGTPASYAGALPAGLILNTSTGSITGTPTAASTATAYTVTATYGGGVTATTSITITVNPPAPVISYTPSTNAFILNQAITPLTPANTGGAAASYTISPGLPAGLSFSTSTGVISGTPTALSAAANYTITATNTGGTGSTTVNLKVVPLPPAISYTPSTNYYVLLVGIPALTPVNTGGIAVSYSISPGLPLGLSFNTSTGAITGTPLIVSALTTYTITATNTGGTGSTTVILKVDLLGPTIAYLPATNTYTVGTAITTLNPTILTGTPSSYSISAPLPAGLLFNTATGAISGTATTTSPSTNYTITASNAGGSGSTVINITCVNPPPPNISYSPSTNTYIDGTAITTLTPTNSGGPIAGGYSINTPLPNGLSFNTTTGAISGAPIGVSPTTTYTISASNAGGTSNTNVTITVNPKLPVISYSPSTNVYVINNAITPLTPSNTGGAIVSYSISAPLPTGLSFNTSTGVISGTPTVVSTATTYTITATNVTGSGTTTVNLTVNPIPPVISYSPSTNFYTVGTAIASLTPTSTGGPVASYSIDIPLPSGLTLNTTTGVISGTPTTDITVTTFTITATNAGGTGSTTITLTVYPLPPIIKYTPSTYTYTVGVAITPADPTNTGGHSSIYNIGPALPAGLTFDNTTGEIAGTPTGVSPATNYIISADNDGGTGTTTVTIACNNPTAPAISYSPSTNVYTSGTAIATLTPSNTGGPASSYSINTPLPSGLSFDTSTGIISGTPTGTSSTTVYTITATNAAGNASTTVTLTVNPSGPNISYSPATNIYSVGAAITPLSPSNSGGAISSYSISSALPAGLSFNTATGVISGTPTAISATTVYTITATNTTGTSSTTETITINNLGPAITYTPATVTYSVGTPITAATPTNTGGAASTFAITAGGSLPAGLSFNTTNGTISGTPTVVFPTTTFTIKATNSSGSSSTNLIITVSPHAPIISYTPSTNVYPLNAPIATLAPVNTGGAVTGYSYSSTGVALTGASLSGPSLMFIDASGNIYVANYNNGTVSRWNSAHTYLGTYTTGKGLTSPEGIVFDSSGNCYVEDTGAGAIYKYNSSGVYQGTIISGLNHPLGISIDPSNNLYIATYVYTSPYTSSVTKYSTTGTLLQTISNTQMDESDGVSVDASGNIYVLNRAQDQSGTNKGYVTKYNSSGTYVGIFSSGYEDPLAISNDPSGNVFVADSHNNQVKIYSSNGVLLNTISGFNDVEGFVADGNGNLYVSDFTNNTVKEFAANGGYYINSPLPAGLSFNSSNGQITGTPTVTFPPTTYTITAYNITGSGSTTVTLSCYQSNDWIGVTSTDWNTPSNWLSNQVPTSAQSALIGVNRTFNYFPTVLAGSGTTNVGSVQFGNLGGQSSGVIVSTGSTLNVVGAITYQSDASAGSGYTTTISGAGTINVNSISVISNTVLGSSYTSIMASSVNSLNVAGNIALTSSNSGAALFNAAFNVTGGTTQLTGTVQTTNTATSTSTFTVTPASTATLQFVNSTALSGLSATGTNVVNFYNAGATVQYSGAAQTVYTSAAITGLAAGVRYQNIIFSGTGVKTALSGNLNIAGDFTNTMANDASNYVNVSSPSVNFSGASQNLVGGGGNGTTFTKVFFAGAGTKTMVSGQFNIATTGVLTMGGSSTSTILAANGLLTLNSDANSSASIAAIPTGPSITGNVNVQRYVTGGAGYRNYRLASSPVYAGTVASNNVYNLNYVQNSIYLTGVAGGGFDKVGNPTLYLYREDLVPSNATFISGNYLGISSINSAPTYYVNSGATAYNIPVGNGFLFFFRGNRASASLATETTTAYTTPVTVTMSATGTLNQGQVVVYDWYTPTSPYLGYTGSGAGTNSAVRGFNMVGNPYASSIDWETFNTTTTTSGIYGNNVGTTIYELNPATDNFDTYQIGGVYTNHGRRTIVSGQGFFVLAGNNSSPQLIFNETAKSTAQNTGLNLLMSTKGEVANLEDVSVEPHIRLQMAMDSINTDDTYIGFNSATSPKYVENEDAPYKLGNGKVSFASYSSDGVRLAINKTPLPLLRADSIPLFVSARAAGNFTLNMTELVAIPAIYKVWLKDNFLKDSLDMRANKTYAFSITADTNSYGSKRFTLIVREDPALGMHLLSFTATKVTSGAQVTWITDNEQDYTHFTVERSTDGGVTYNVLTGFVSNAQGTYGYLDTAPVAPSDMYRLKLEDLNGTITYSKVVTLTYKGSSSIPSAYKISIFPNPATSIVNLNIVTNKTATSNNGGLITGPGLPASNNVVFTINIISASGATVKTVTTSDTNWQSDVSSILPGTYIIQVTNSTDHSLVGQGTFVKL